MSIYIPLFYAVVITYSCPNPYADLANLYQYFFFLDKETCENWHSLVNSWVYYARKTREIYQVLPQGRFEINWIRQYFVN